MSAHLLSVSRLENLGPRSLSRYWTKVLSDPPSDNYLSRTLGSLTKDFSRPAELRRRAAVLLESLSDSVDRRQFALASFIEELGRYGAVAPTPREAGVSQPPTRSETISGLSVVAFVPHIRAPFNAGNIVRSAAAFGISGVVFGEACPAFDHPRFLRAAMGSEALVSVSRGDIDTAVALVTPDVPVIALETGGTPIHLFTFPRSGVLILGHEELGLSQETVSRAADSGGVLSIPLGGAKSSLNVGVAFGIALSWWSLSHGTSFTPVTG